MTIFVGLVLSTAAVAQSQVDLTKSGQAQFGELTLEKIKPLEELILLAMENEPLIDAFTTTQERTKQEIEIARKRWLQHFSVTAGAGYANGIVSDQLTTGGVFNDINLTYSTTQTAYANIGVSIRFPFSELATRKNEIRIKELEIERVEYLKSSQYDKVTEQVIKSYSELKYALKTIELKQEVVETNNIAMEIAESYFKAGKLPVEQYRSAVDKSYSGKIALEKAKNEAWFAFRSLKELIGRSILR